MDASPNQHAFSAMMSGLAVGSFLAGLATLQTIAFFFVNRRDPLLHKAFVFLLWVLDMLQMILHAYSVWYCVIDQGKVEVVSLPWGFRIQVFMVITIAILSKILYVVRIWNLATVRKRKPFLAIFLITMLSLELGFGLLSGYEMYQIQILPALAHIDLKWAALVAISLVTLDDVLITVGLVYSFVGSMGKMNLGWTDSSIVMLSAYVLNTGFIGALFSLIGLIAFALNSVSPLFFVDLIIMPQIYTNCFLAMMNARLYFSTLSSGLTSSKLPLPRVFLPTHHDTHPPSIPGYAFGSAYAFGYGSRMSVNSSTSPIVQAPYTINDAGLPFFTSGSHPDPQQDRGTNGMPLEVFVQTRKQAKSGWRKFTS